jgi:hypothetical protein
MKILMENWRKYLNEDFLDSIKGYIGGTGTGGSYDGKIIFYDDPKPHAIIGVSHKGPLDRELSDEIKNRLAPIAEQGFYCEGDCKDVPKLKKFMRDHDIRLGSNKGQFDKPGEINTDKINWAYTLFTGNDFNSKIWPEMILDGRNDGSIPGDAFEAFQNKEDKSAADIIKLMLIATGLVPGLEEFSEDEADQVLDILRRSGVHIDTEAHNIVTVMEKAHLTLFPGGGDVESNTPIGELAKNVQGKRRELLKKKLERLGGVGIIGYSHIPHFMKEHSGGQIV